MIMFQLILNHKVPHVIIGAKMHEIITSSPSDNVIFFLLGVNNLAPSLQFPQQKKFTFKAMKSPLICHSL